jgi:hypothetical protein
MRADIPLRTQWRAVVQNWPAERRGRFEQRLNARRLLSPTENADWAFLDTFRTFRRELLDQGEMTLEEVHPGLSGPAHRSETGVTWADWLDADRLTRDALRMGEKRRAVNGAQLRLIDAASSPQKWD